MFVLANDVLNNSGGGLAGIPGVIVMLVWYPGFLVGGMAAVKLGDVGLIKISYFPTLEQMLMGLGVVVGIICLINVVVVKMVKRKRSQV